MSRLKPAPARSESRPRRSALSFAARAWRARPRAVLLAATLAGALSGATSGTAVADERTLAQSVYTAAQADNGKPLYASHCATCHEPGYFRDVFRAWQGETMGSLFNVMAGTMPQSNPGSLMDQEYLDILAYVLQENDFPAGDESLEIMGGGLREIVIVAAP